MEWAAPAYVRTRKQRPPVRGISHDTPSARNACALNRTRGSFEAGPSGGEGGAAPGQGRRALHRPDVSL